MRLSLTRHPDTPCAVVDEVVVDVLRSAGGALALAYRLTGRTAALRLPPPAAPARADELWKHTCFEAFVKPTGGEAYVEVNLAPSGAWQAYRFGGYREGMAPADMPAPTSQVRVAPGAAGLETALDLAVLPAGPWRLGLSAVIEAADGTVSYWALRHPPAGKPDFHHPAAFAYDLADPEAP